jgi:hypothetical protein
MFFMSLVGNEVANDKLENELIASLEVDKKLFSSIDEITSETVRIFDLAGEEIEIFKLARIIENDLSLKQTVEIEKADLMFEYQGDLFYLKG